MSAKRNLLLSVGCLALAVGGLLLLTPHPAQAFSLTDGLVGPSQDPSQINGRDIFYVLGRIIQYLLLFIGAVAAISIVVNGYQYILSAGNPEKLEKAKQGLTWSIGGFILAISAYAIVLFEQTVLRSRNKVSNPYPGINVDPRGPDTPQFVITQLIQLLLAFAGAVAVIFIILGGYRYITSQGNQENVEKAKNTITYAVIGLVVAMIAYVLVQLVKTTLRTTSI